MGLLEHRLKIREDPGTFGTVEECAAAAAAAAVVVAVVVVVVVVVEPASGIHVLFWQVVAAVEVVVEVAEGADVESQEYWMDTGYAAGQDLSAAEFRIGWGNLTPKRLVVAAAAMADYVSEEWNQGTPVPYLAAANWDTQRAGSDLSALPARAPLA